MNTTVRALNISSIISLDKRAMATIYQVNSERPADQSAVQVKLGRTRYWVGFSLCCYGNGDVVRNTDDSRHYATQVAEYITKELAQRSRSTQVTALSVEMHANEGFKPLRWKLRTEAQLRNRFISRIVQAVGAIAIGFAAAFSQVVKAEETVTVQVDNSEGYFIYCHKSLCLNEATREFYNQDVPDGYYFIQPVVSEVDATPAEEAPKKSS